MAGKDTANREQVTVFSRSPLTIRSSLFIAHCSLFILFVSCQSAPKVFEMDLNNTASVPLDSGASVYILADAKQARPIIDLLPVEELNNRQTVQMLDRTDFFAAALFPEASKLRFQLVSWGNYPDSGAAMAFGMNKNWKKRRSRAGYSYWHLDGLSIALNSRQTFVCASSDNAPGDPVTNGGGAKIPEGFGEFCAAAPLSCWLENPAPVFSRILNNAGVPIRFPVQQLFVNLYPVTERRCEALIRMQFENAIQARGMAAIFSLAGNFSPNEIIASIFLKNPPVQNGRNLDIKTVAMSETEIALLFGLLSI